MAVPTQLLALLLCLWSLTLVCSFNLEPRIPIVKKGSAKSHFGYTVAQHQTIIGGRKKPWILVGAPKGQNLQPGTNRSGALWKCPLTTRTSDCEQVKTDGFKDPETGLYNFENLNEALAEPAEDEIKDDQWLGVTLKSQGPGGKVLVCAHRYMHKGSAFQWGFGLCYILSQQLDMDDYLEPCRGKPVNEGHQQYGFCQAGTSGLLLEDEAVLGIPGPYTWRGTVHTSNISEDFLLRDKTQYFGPVTENDSPVDKYSYLGYSVTAGRFFGNYMSYVGGAPRANETGQVVFFSREKIGESLLRVDLVLQGEMFASSFGFEVLGVDINGDRRDDLVVGAPFYYTSKSSGAVYVYMNNDGGFKENHPYTKIEGAAGESRFGFSMTSLGDLNNDGYNDIAIGAPYEGHGAIYIYLGTRNGLLKEPSQVIHAEDMPGISYNAFGYALSGGMDLDGNGYPDLLTSSFCSDRVLLIRARPIIDIYTEVKSRHLENIDPTKKGCTEDIESSETCFSFDACFKMDNNAGTRTGLRLKYEIEEFSERPLARVRFGDSDVPSIAHRDIDLRPEDMGRLECNTETVYLLDGPRNILQPLKFKLSYEIVQREPRPVNEGDPVPDIDDYPILNQQEALRYFEGTFAKDCGDDDVCISDLEVSGRLDLQKEQRPSRYILKLGEQDTVSLRVEVSNTGEPAYQSTLLVTHHQALAFDLIESEIGSHQCSQTSKTQLQCSIGNPLIKTSGPLVLSFKESSFPFDSKYIQFTVAANSTSREGNPQEPLNFLVEVIKRAEVSIIGSVAPEQAFYGGDVVGESAIEHMDEVGMEVTHKYVVDNQGPWRVDELKVEVLWPHQVENNKEQGKWLLYMTEIPTVDGIGECEIDPSHVNPLIMDRQPFPGKDGYRPGLEVEGELETTDFSGSHKEVTDGSFETSTKGSVKITKTTSVTETKKVTTSKKKFSSKSSSSQDISKSAGKTSHEYSSSSGSSTSGFSSSSGYSDRAPVDDETEGSGYGFDRSGRVHGRTHSRVSRRVYSSEHKSRLPDHDFRINELDDNFDDEDGDVVSHHEESHSSTRTSPDGSTTLTESHHESRKVTVKEGSIDDIPVGKWGHDGGFHRGSTDDRTFSTGRRYYGEEERRISTSGQRGFQDGMTTSEDAQEGSGSFAFEGSEPDWRREGGIHRQETSVREETVRRVHSGAASRRYGTDDQTGTRRVDSDFQGSLGSTDGHEASREVYSEGSSSSRGQTDSRTYSGVSGGYGKDGTIRTHTEYDSRRYYSSIGEDSTGAHGEDRHNGSDQEPRERVGAHVAESDRHYQGRYGGEDRFRTNIEDSGSWRKGSRTYDIDHERRINTGSRYDQARESSGDRYGGSVRTEGGTTHRQDWRLHGGTHRASTADDSLRRVDSGDTARTHGVDDSGRFYGYDDFSHTTRDGGRRDYTGGDHRSRAGVDGYASSSRGSDGDESYRRHYSREYERTSSSGGWRTDADQDVRAGPSESNRSDSLGLHSEHRRTEHFNWNYGRDGGYGEEPSKPSHFRDYDRFSEGGRGHSDGGGVRGHSDVGGGRGHSDGGGGRGHSDVGGGRGHSDVGGGRGHSDGGDGRGHSDGGGRHYSGGSSWRSSDSDGLRETTWRTHQTNYRTSTAEGGKHDGARWASTTRHSLETSGSRDEPFGLRESDFDDFTSNKNGTYKRVEVDPETGTTTVYTKTVYSNPSHWQGSWDRRPDSESSSFGSRNDDPHRRNRRELSRVKREKELIIKPQAITDAQTGKTMQVVNLNCDGDIPTAKCFRFTCNIRNLGAKQAASIRIKSRLWNSTLVEDYPRVSYVSIKSKAALILPEDIRNDQDQSDDVASAETLAYPDLLDQLPPEEVPLWVILVSIFAGLLVLIIIVLILWKLGFFERKRPDPTLSGNLDKDANGY